MHVGALVLRQGNTAMPNWDVMAGNLNFVFLTAFPFLSRADQLALEA